jgi:hypothetical protein
MCCYEGKQNRFACKLEIDRSDRLILRGFHASHPQPCPTIKGEGRADHKDQIFVPRLFAPFASPSA